MGGKTYDQFQARQKSKAQKKDAKTGASSSGNPRNEKKDNQ